MDSKMQWYVDGYNKCLKDTKEDVIGFLKGYMKMLGENDVAVIQAIEKIYSERYKTTLE